MKIPENLSEVTKWQKAHISLKWCWIKKIKALYFLQLWKLKKGKCTYFLDQRSTWWAMIILLFHEDTRHPILLVPVKKYSHQSILVKLTSSNVFCNLDTIYNPNPTEFLRKLKKMFMWVHLLINIKYHQFFNSGQNS